MSIILECNNLSHKYGKKTALDDISFSIETGKVVGLFGPNGSGKTTLIKKIVGLLLDDKQSVKIDGKPVGETTKAIVSYSPDRLAFKGNRKISYLLDFYELMYDDFDRAHAEEVLAGQGIQKDECIGKLSKGTCEKIQIILVMSRKAKLYILDEPFSGIDPVARETVIRIMLQNMSEEASLLLSTHHIQETEQIIDDAIFLKEGKIVFQKSVEEMREESSRSLNDAYMEVFR
ncbi:MAG: ABC transporter ATP-binding protein [Lachnospiraceae bacterium]|nr:ABC transporter ATP-binding protein [Lachnospiraceae bacterium]